MIPIEQKAQMCIRDRVLVEVAFIKLCRPAMETNTDVLLDRIRVLEQEFEAKMEELESGAISYGGGWQNGAPASAPAEPKKPVPAPPAPRSLPEDVQNVVKNWHNVLNRLHPLLRTYLKLSLIHICIQVTFRQCRLHSCLPGRRRGAI